MGMIRKASRSLAVAVAVGTLAVGLGAAAGVEAGARRDAPLVAAVKAADVDTVRTLVGDRAVDVNLAEPDGATALHWAVHRSDAELVDLLIAAGADVTATNRYGVQPISLAAENGNAAILAALIDSGADPNATLPEGETVLMTAARTGDAASIRTLLVRGADPNARDRFRGQTALMWTAARNNADAVHVLAELGADIHARTESALRAPNGNRLFYAPPPTGFTALMFAARGGHLDAMRVLLAAGANVNDTLSDGQSALVVAVANANWELADYLLDRGADPNLAGAGWNALHQLLRTRRMNTGFGFPAPIPSGRVDSIDVLKKMIELGGDVDARMTTNGMKDGQRNRLNRLGATPFFLAAKVTDTEAMRVLVEADADAVTPNADGTTPHGAAFRGANNVVEYLVEQGADLDARTDLGYSPLAIADGFSYSDFYKAQKHTARLLHELMQTRDIPTGGEGHVVPGSVCFDCLQTRGDQIRERVEREAELETEFNAQFAAEREQ